MNRLLIKNVEIVDFSDTLKGDIYIENSIIKEIGTEIEKDCITIDGKGKTLMPAFIDMHAHFREPGFEYKENIESGSKAAVRGGYGSVLLMANTNPSISNKKQYDYVMDKAKKIDLINVHQCVTVTKNMNGCSTEHLDEMLNIDEVKFISEDGKGVMDSKIMIEAMNKSKKKNAVVISHAESHDLSTIDMRLAENTMTWRDILLAEYTKSRLHIAHVSTKEAINYIIEGKRKGIKLTCEVTPHHIALNNSTKYRVNPPLREEEDRLALIEAVKNGYVDCIGTDHAPHSDEDKLNGAPGMIGLEFAFTVCNTKLVKEGHITINELSYLMSKGPAKIMNDNLRGSIAIGKIADLVLIDKDIKVVLSKEDIMSKSHNSPLIGFEGYGKILMTIRNGKTVYEEGEF